MKINGLSASAYDSYDWCQWKYFLTQVLGFEDESGPAATMGHIAHKVLEILSKAAVNKHDPNSKIWDVNYLWEIVFNHEFNSVPTSAEGIKDDKLLKVCKGIHELLRSDHTPIRDNTIGAEIKFRLPIENPDFLLEKGKDKYFVIRGKIDRVDKINEDTIEIVDYKTGTRTDYNSKERKKKDADKLHEEIQCRMYHYAAAKLYPWAKNILVTFIYLVDGGAIPVKFSEEDFKTTEEIVYQRFKAIKANNDPQRNITWKCKSMCSFYKDGTCDHVWQEKDELGMEFIENKYRILNNKWRKK